MTAHPDEPDLLTDDEERAIAAAVQPRPGFNRPTSEDIAACLQWASEARLGEAYVKFAVDGALELRFDPEENRVLFAFRDVPAIN